MSKEDSKKKKRIENLLGLIDREVYDQLYSIMENGSVPTKTELDRFIRGLGYVPSVDLPVLNDEEIEIGRKAVEDALIEWRDNRLSEFNRGNGLVIREKDGKDSYIIRFGFETALRIALKAITQRDDCMRRIYEQNTLE